MGLLDTLRGKQDDSSLAETAKRQGWQLTLMEENLRALEDAAEDGQWRRIGANLEREFTRDGLDDLMSMSRAMYLSNPLIQRAVNVRTYYTWGQGVDFSADEQIMKKVIDPMLEDDGNQMELFSHQARLLTDVDQEVDGNTFFALFRSTPTEPARVRSIPAEEIRKIYRDPDDRNKVLYYRRKWSALVFNEATGVEETKDFECLYPDIGHDLINGPETVGGIEVRWESPVIHQKVGGLKQMSFGVPTTYAALDWARAYKKFLEDWHTIVSSLARFAWKVTTKVKKVDRVGKKISGDGSDDELGPRSTRRPTQPAGSVFVGSADDSITPIAKSGANTSADDARASRLMVGTAMDLPDTILSGDADVGNLATAKSLDRPTELAMTSRQLMWSHWYQRLFGWAIEDAIRSRRLGQIAPDKRAVQVKFPSILEHDMKDTVSALISAATLDGKAEAGTMPREELSRMLMTAIGVEDVQDQIDKLDTTDQVAVAAAVERLREVLEGE